MIRSFISIFVMQPQDAWSILEPAYIEHAETLRQYCRSKNFCKEDAEEIVQEAFLKTYQYLTKGGDVQDIRHFLYKVTGNLIIDTVRKHKNRQTKEVSLDNLTDQGFELSNKNSESGLQRRIDVKEQLITKARLKKENKEILILRFMRGLSPQEIAQKTGLTSNAVSIRLHRIIKTITASMKTSSRMPSALSVGYLQNKDQNLQVGKRKKL